MASRTSKTKGMDEGQPTLLSAFARDLARRRAEAGEFTVARNPGKTRTPSKRALLKAIKDAGGRW